MNPKEYHQRPLHSDRVTVWCAVSRMGIIGPYFFEENGRAVTVNSVRYLTVIEEFFTCSPRNGNDQRVVPGRWSHSPHCQNVNGLFENSFSWTTDLFERGCELDCEVA